MGSHTSIYEKQIIGGILSGAIKAGSLTIRPDDMPEMGTALKASLEIEAKGLAVDANALYAKLLESDVDGLFYSVDDYLLFARTAQSSAVVLEAVDKIKASALRTYLTEKLSSIVADESRSGVSILDELKEMIGFADGQFKTSENSFLMMPEIVEKLDAVYKDFLSGVSYAVATGFSKLDELLLDGFSKGDLHIVVGMTGGGKSAFALNCARYQAMSGNLVGVVSREMSDVENVMRIQSSVQDIPRWQMKRGIYDSTYQQLAAGFDSLKRLPIAFDTRTSDVETLRIQVKRMVDQFDMKILYVDYLQLVGVSKTRGSRAEDVAAVSRGLKEVAMENNIPVVALSQFNRGANNAEVENLLGHLKESSGIEQDASTVTYIQVDNSDPESAKKPAKILVLKNRNGTTFKPIYFTYHGATFTFVEDDH